MLPNLIASLRHLNETATRQGEIAESTWEALESLADAVEAKYAEYEDTPAPRGAEALRDLMMEAYARIGDGVEEYLLFSEDLKGSRLDQGLALVQEGFDIMEAVRYAILQDSNLVAGAALG